METISGSIAISYNPGKEIYTLRFDPAAGDANKRHKACQADGRSCGRVRLNLADALQFLQKAGSVDPAALLAKTRVSGGSSIKASITRHQHGSLFEA
jgi:hypothetical protein